MWGQSQTSAVPRMVSYSGVLKDAGGHAVTGLAGVAHLWLETQSVKPDASGRYTMQLGFGERARTSVRVFMSGEGRWLAVWIGSEAEPPRVLLVAVPYAMKAADAETVGGLRLPLSPTRTSWPASNR